MNDDTDVFFSWYSSDSTVSAGNYITILFFFVPIWQSFSFAANLSKQNVAAFWGTSKLWSFTLHRSQGFLLLTQAPSNCINYIFEQALSRDISFLTFPCCQMTGRRWTGRWFLWFQRLPPPAACCPRRSAWERRPSSTANASSSRAIAVSVRALHYSRVPEVVFSFVSVLYILLLWQMWCVFFSLLSQRLKKRQIQTCRKRWACI